MDYIALAVPFFFVFIALELWLARRRGLRLYRLNDSLSDLAAGIMQQVLLLLYAGLLLAAYAWVYEHYRFITWKNPLWPWLIAFCGVDFFYYWWHRLSHEVNVLWAAHVVHHQSEEFNLSVALRQSVVASWTYVPFYLPLALLGVPPLVEAAMVSFSTLYQFWIHTQLVGKIRGPLHWIFNLPEHHRVHHAINPQYLDKNYAAVLIVWDRLFGTFTEEDEAPVYGITKPLASWNPLWAQTHYWVEMAHMMRATPRWRDKLMVPWRGPAWTPPGYDKGETPPLWGRAKYDPPVARAARPWLVVGFAATVLGTFWLMLFAPRLGPVPQAVAVVVVVAALWLIGHVLDRRRDERARAAEAM